MSTTIDSKKRKRNSLSQHPHPSKKSRSKLRTITFKQSTQSKKELGPLLVNCPAPTPHPSTSFKCYTSEYRNAPAKSSKKHKRADVDGSEGEEPDFHERSTLVVGETEDVEFVTDPLQTEAANQQSGCSYLIAVHNTRTGETVFRPAPLHLLERTVKAHKAIKVENTVPLAYAEARTALGQTFGTKKAQAALRAAERNKVDITAMQGVVGTLQSTIAAATEGLPSEEQAAVTAAAARQIPPLNEDAGTPEDVYPLESIIPKMEWDAISIDDMLADDLTLALRIKTLPSVRSDWVYGHMKAQFNAPKQKKKTLKIIYYIAALLSFKRVVGGSKPVEREAIMQKMGTVPSIIVDAMLNRFAEMLRAGAQYKATTDKQNLLMTHVFALCLKVDSFFTDTSVLSRDLSLSVATVNALFKSLGCKITKLTEPQRLRLGVKESEADVKRAVLTCPPTFPKPRSGKKATGRG
ncbi:A49-like RNA polymerase I associated factor-domain-containing protein [Pterulicium gracile]|uniref:A49-like RNA polymerase I associated factor-domain-containing protein n=1 Tax=Pterulicium gracile TaxID=1884261 RepID=A0A5C3Q0D6_9AGAR|nr:A49-like RNA polymerase I associated factor-domain-containing protein [Pterula gracilis]